MSTNILFNIFLAKRHFFKEKSIFFAFTFGHLKNIAYICVVHNRNEVVKLPK